MAYDLDKATGRLFRHISVPHDGTVVGTIKSIKAALVAAYDAGALEEREREPLAPGDPRTLAHVMTHRLFTEVHLPLKTVNELNRRATMFKDRLKRSKDAHIVSAVLHSRTDRRPRFPVVVTLTRLSPSKGLDPHDGLPASQKHIVDIVAKFLGIDDGETDKVTWLYKQEHQKFYSVKIKIEETF